MIQADNFKSFLKENNAYEKFCENISKQRNNSFDEVTMHRDYFGDIINEELYWSRTNEGDAFWSNLNDVWNAAVRNNKQYNVGYKSIW